MKLEDLLRDMADTESVEFENVQIDVDELVVKMKQALADGLSLPVPFGSDTVADRNQEIGQDTGSQGQIPADNSKNTHQAVEDRADHGNSGSINDPSNESGHRPCQLK